MDMDFVEMIPKNYERNVYTAYVNAAVRPEDPDRLTLVYEGGGEAFQLTVDFGPRVEAKGGRTP